MPHNAGETCFISGGLTDHTYRPLDPRTQSTMRSSGIFPYSRRLLTLGAAWAAFAITAGFARSSAAVDGTLGEKSTGSATIRLEVVRILEPRVQPGPRGDEVCVWSNESDTLFDISIPQRSQAPRRLAGTRLASAFRSGRCSPLPPGVLPKLRSDERVVLLLPST